MILLLTLYGVTFFLLLNYFDFLSEALDKYYHSLYTFLEYFAFTTLFWLNIKNRIFKRLIIITSIFFALFQITHVTSTSLQRMDSIPIGVETILIFVFIFYFFFDFSKNTKNIFIYNYYCFWLAVGILIYLGGSFFFYILINNLDLKELNRFANFTYIAEIIKNLLFCLALFLYAKHPVHKNNNLKNIPNLDMNMI